DWPVLDFSTPVALEERKRIADARRRSVAASLLGVALAAAGVLLYTARRRSRRDES
ncbi:MAG: hypothetical protein QOH03_42, partial [Kribbellaceae bacterium]|nr:hypothetical protein [Kribbellaceae bacterium]